MTLKLEDLLLPLALQPAKAVGETWARRAPGCSAGKEARFLLGRPTGTGTSSGALPAAGGSGRHFQLLVRAGAGALIEHEGVEATTSCHPQRV